MAKQEEKAPKFPSRFGSHASMIDEDLTEKLACALENHDEVVLVDDRGPYRTPKTRLDTGLADPNRTHDRARKAQELANLVGMPISFSNHAGA